MGRRFLLSVLLSDLAALGVAVAIGSLLVFDTPFPGEAAIGTTGASIWPLVGLLTGGALVGSWASIRMWARGVPRPSYGRAVSIVAAATVLTALGIVVSRVAFSRPFLATTVGVWLLGALAHRAIRRRRPWTEILLLVTGEKGLTDDLRTAPHADVYSVLDPSGEPPSETFPPNVTLGLDLRPVMSDRMAQFVSSWNLAGYPIRPLSTVYEEHTGRLPMVHLAEGWELSAPVSRNEYAAFKWPVDVVLVVLTAPLWIALAALIALAVKLDSRGPAIYTQQRVGFDGNVFTLYKFRTMVEDAEADGPQFAGVLDERLTRAGRWLRRFRIDEIPQLWNVLKGDLSIVGPRPERPEFTEQYERSIPFYGYRGLTRPGVTGWAQVNYGYADDEADTIEKLTYDLYYVKHMSPWLDLQIMGRSLWTMLSGFGHQ
jgi:lipopolysaccharide/colanic/teichoic acid biosynthesis glycosyltransferase